MKIDTTNTNIINIIKLSVILICFLIVLFPLTYSVLLYHDVPYAYCLDAIQYRFLGFIIKKGRILGASFEWWFGGVIPDFLNICTNDFQSTFTAFFKSAITVLIVNSYVKTLFNGFDEYKKSTYRNCISIIAFILMFITLYFNHSFSFIYSYPFLNTNENSLFFEYTMNILFYILFWNLCIKNYVFNTDIKNKNLILYILLVFCLGLSNDVTLLSSILSIIFAYLLNNIKNTSEEKEIQIFFIRNLFYMLLCVYVPFFAFLYFTLIFIYFISKKSINLFTKKYTIPIINKKILLLISFLFTLCIFTYMNPIFLKQEAQIEQGISYNFLTKSTISIFAKEYMNNIQIMPVSFVLMTLIIFLCALLIYFKEKQNDDKWNKMYIIICSQLTGLLLFMNSLVFLGAPKILGESTYIAHFGFRAMEKLIILFIFLSIFGFIVNYLKKQQIITILIIIISIFYIPNINNYINEYCDFVKIRQKIKQVYYKMDSMVMFYIKRGEMAILPYEFYYCKDSGINWFKYTYIDPPYIEGEPSHIFTEEDKFFYFEYFSGVYRQNKLAYNLPQIKFVNSDEAYKLYYEKGGNFNGYNDKYPTFHKLYKEFFYYFYKKKID